MKIPNKLKVGGQTYNISFTDKTIGDDGNIDGYCQYSDLKITIKKNMPEDYTEYVFLHELIHAMFEEMQWEQKEENVSALAHKIHQVFKDNKLGW